MKVVWMGKAQWVIPSCKVWHLPYFLPPASEHLTDTRSVSDTDHYNDSHFFVFCFVSQKGKKNKKKNFVYLCKGIFESSFLWQLDLYWMRNLYIHCISVLVACLLGSSLHQYRGGKSAKVNHPLKMHIARSWSQDLTDKIVRAERG